MKIHKTDSYFKGSVLLFQLKVSSTIIKYDLFIGVNMYINSEGGNFH